MSEVTCILCGTNQYAKTLYAATVTEADLNEAVFSARRLPDRIHETILRCTRCGLVYPKHLIDQEKLKALYAKSTYTYQQEETHIRRTYGRYLLKAAELLKGRPRPWSYIDIGCGNGFMLQEAMLAGFEETAGVEPSRHAIEMAHPSVQDRLIQSMFSASITQGKKFDLLSCFQTLDHIPDPVSFVHECFEVIKPGGLVLFINHNIASWTARLLGERCPMIDIEHTYLHTPGSMRELFGRAGFTDIRLFPVRNDYPLYYWVHLIPGPKKLKEKLVGALKNMRIGRLIIPFYPGNLGMIARRPG